MLHGDGFELLGVLCLSEALQDHVASHEPSADSRLAPVPVRGHPLHLRLALRESLVEGGSTEDALGEVLDLGAEVAVDRGVDKWEQSTLLRLVVRGGCERGRHRELC